MGTYLHIGTSYEVEHTLPPLQQNEVDVGIVTIKCMKKNNITSTRNQQKVTRRIRSPFGSVAVSTSQLQNRLNKILHQYRVTDAYLQGNFQAR